MHWRIFELDPWDSILYKSWSMLDFIAPVTQINEDKTKVIALSPYLINPGE